MISFDSKEICLTSDPVALNSLDRIEIKVDRFKPFLIDPMRMPDGKQKLFYDVSQLPHGKHKVWLRGVKNHKFGPITKFEFRI